MPQPTKSPPADFAPDPSPGARRKRRLAAVAIAAVSVGLVAVWLSLLYSLSWHLFIGNSDDANALLAGHALLHGNLLLRHWRMPTDNYWSIDLPWYGLFASLIGLGASVLHAVPTLIAAGVAAVSTGAALAPFGAPRRWAGALVTFALLGLPTPLLGTFLLQGPMHIGTVLLCLASFLLLTKGFGQRWWLAVALLGAAVLGDPLAVALGAGPVAGAAIVSGLTGRSYKLALPGVTAALTSVAAAIAGGQLLRSLGGFTTAPRLPLSPSANWITNVRAIPGRLSWLLGASPHAPMPHVWALFWVLHAVGAATIVIGVAAASIALVLSATRIRNDGTRRVPTPWIDNVLAVGFWFGLLVFIVFTLPRADINSTRYLVPSVVYGAILGGRLVARHFALSSGRASLVMVTLLAALTFGSYILVSAAIVRSADVANSAQPLARWLKASRLDVGFGPYWDASIVTVVSHGDIKVRPVIVANGRLHGLAYFASSEWFRAGHHERSFLVYEPAAPWGGVNDSTAIQTFGLPSSIIDRDRYRVLIWDKDVGSLVGQATDLPH